MAYQQFKEHISSLLGYAALQFRVIPDRMEASDLSFSRLLSNLEYCYTINAISNLLSSTSDNDHIDDEIKGKWVQLLSARWQRIENTNIAYTEHSHHPVNLICIQIADHLQQYSGKSRFYYLMPTLDEKAVSVTREMLDEKQFSIAEFTVSDDNKRLIHVGDCLSYAETDCVLKHTILPEEKEEALNASERQRVIKHTSQSTALFQCIKNRHKFKTETDTFGRRLQLLIDDLRRGGVQENGQELDAGVEANKALVDFGQFLEALASEDKDWLLSLRNYSENTLEKILNPAKIKFDKNNPREYESVHHCVELIAYGIGDVLSQNRQALYDRKVQEDSPDPQGHYQTLEQNLTRARKLYEDSLNYAIIKTNAYGRAGDTSLAAQLADLPIDINDDTRSLCYKHCFKAAADGDVYIIDFLHKFVDLDQQNDEGKSLLHVAVENWQTGVISRLLSRQANPNVFDNQGRSPLQLAVCKNNEAAVSALLADKRTNPNLENDRWYSPLLQAIIYSYSTIINMLLARNDLRLSVDDCHAVFKHAGSTNDYRLLNQWLLKIDAETLEQWLKDSPFHKYGFTLYMVPDQAQVSESQCIEKISQYDNRVLFCQNLLSTDRFIDNMGEVDCIGLLHLAIYAGNKVLVDDLLVHPAIANYIFDHANFLRLLTFAEGYGYAGMYEFLLDHKLFAENTSAIFNSHNLVNDIISHDKPEIIRTLLTHHAVQLTDVDYRTIFDTALQKDNVNLLSCFIDHVQNRDSGWFDDNCHQYVRRSLSSAARSGNLELIKVLAQLPKAGLDQESSDHDFGHVLTVAAGHKHLPIVEYLVEELHFPVKPAGQGRERHSALIRAADNKDQEMVAYLLSRGADPFFTDYLLNFFKNDPGSVIFLNQVLQWTANHLISPAAAVAAAYNDINFSLVQILDNVLLDFNILCKAYDILDNVQDLKNSAADDELLTEILLQVLYMVLLTKNALPPDQKEKDPALLIAAFHSYTRENVPGHPSKAWQNSGKALIISGALILIVLGILISVASFGIGSAPGIAMSTIGGGLIASSGASFFHGRPKGLSKQMYDLGNEVENIVQRQAVVACSNHHLLL